MKSTRLLSAALLFVSVPVLAASEKAIIATGSCLHRVEPDRAALVVTADVMDKDLKTSMRRANDSYEAARKDIKKLELAHLELTTTEYSVQEQNEWVKDHSVFKGFRTRIGLRVATSDLSRLGEIIPIAARHDIHEIGQVATFLSDELARKERNSCLRAAVEEAELKAEKMAEGLKVSLGGPRAVRELGVEDGQPPRPFQAMRMAKGAAESAESMPMPSFEAGKQEVRTAVEVEFEFSK